MLETLFKGKGKEAMQQSALAEDVDSIKAELLTATSMLAAKEEVITELNSKLESVTSKLAELQEYAKQAEAAAEAIKAEAAAKLIEEKKQMLADVIGRDNESFDATFNAIASLDNDAYKTVISGFAASLVKEANSEMFKETGVSGEAEVSKTKLEADASAVMNIINKIKNK